MFLKIVCSCLC